MFRLALSLGLVACGPAPEDMQGEDMTKAPEEVSQVEEAAYIGACPSNFVAYRGGASGYYHSCYCAPGVGNSGPVWGTTVYSDDSSPCRAAAHACKIDPNAGGIIYITIAAGRTSYTASTGCYGVTSASWGSWPGSYYFRYAAHPRSGALRPWGGLGSDV